jgi:hypothetical protein
MRVHWTTRSGRDSRGGQGSQDHAQVSAELRHRCIAIFGLHRHGALDNGIEFAQQFRRQGTQLGKVARVARGRLGGLGNTQAELAGFLLIIWRIMGQAILQGGQIGLFLLQRLVARRNAGRLMGGQREVQRPAQRIDI